MELDDLPQPERVATVPPDELNVDGDNPNEQTDAMFGLLCENMRTKGWLGNHIIADTDGLIADGEHRWRAAQEIGLEEVPVKFYEIDDAERRLWRQELNKISGEHDKKRDALEYKELLDTGKSDEVNELVEATGEDLDELLAELSVDSGVPPAYEYDPEHNVYFEDCVEGMRERLDDDSVDCVITDPPYGIDVEISMDVDPNNPDTRSKEPKHGGTVENDKDIDGAIDLFRNVLNELSRVVKSEGSIYVFASWKTSHHFRRLLDDSRFEVRNRLMWVKDNSVTMHTWGNDGKPSYAYKHEDVFFACGEDAPALSGSPDDVLHHSDSRFSDMSDGSNFHPTQKPVSLIQEFIENSTREGDRVLDPFMGSGTTAVAAIQNDRDYVGFELDGENYQNVIERRIGEAKRQMQAVDEG